MAHVRYNALIQTEKATLHSLFTSAPTTVNSVDTCQTKVVITEIKFLLVYILVNIIKLDNVKNAS
jgi:hypothetical protein